jgi:hypothetical protein
MMLCCVLFHDHIECTRAGRQKDKDTTVLTIEGLNMMQEKISIYIHMMYMPLARIKKSMLGHHFYERLLCGLWLHCYTLVGS